jgi:hypothetical protein
MSTNISQMVRRGLPAESDDFKPMFELTGFDKRPFCNLTLEQMQRKA